MEFGKVFNVDAVDFQLPKFHPLSEQTFARFTKSNSPNIYIGCPVWADKSYVGKVFPPKTPTKNYLKEYCKQFNTIEVNATHYQIPTPETIQKWKAAASPGFKFCPKFPQIISHRNDFELRDEWVDLFLSSVYQLDEHLGTSFIQFPPYFNPSKLKKLELFIQKLPTDLNFAVELRNEQWFSSQTIVKEWFDLFSRYNITPVITDTSGRRDVLHQVVASDKVFIRFVGNNLHETDYTRIDTWVTAIAELLQKGIKDVYFFIHEPQKHFCADIAGYLIDQLNKKEALKLVSPHIYSPADGLLF